jgi:hypothetical protein
MPDAVCLLREFNPLGFFFAFRGTEKAKFYACRVVGIEGKVDPFPVPNGAKRIRVTR